MKSLLFLSLTIMSLSSFAARTYSAKSTSRSYVKNHSSDAKAAQDACWRAEWEAERAAENKCYKAGEESCEAIEKELSEITFSSKDQSYVCDAQVVVRGLR